MPHSLTITPSINLERQVAELQEQVHALQAELEHAGRLATLGTLAAGIAHEINNILTPVLAYAQLAERSRTDDILKVKAIESAIHGVQSATQIAQAMLGFAANTDEPSSANVLDVIDDALICIGRDLSKDRVTLKLNVDPNIDVRMRPLALQQVIMNLILNARSAIRATGRAGDVTISAVVRGDGTTSIAVSDTGPGISAQIASRLFQPFVTSRRRTADASGNSGGNGLGLSICRQLIEAASGSIKANSAPGAGATFTIVLPSCVDASAAAI